MKFMVRFSEAIGLVSLQKQCDSTESVENLEILISLNYDDMDNAKILYEGRPLTEKQKKLHDIFKPNQVNEIIIVPKNDIQAFALGAQKNYEKYSDFFKTNPIAFAGGIVAVILLLIILMS